MVEGRDVSVGGSLVATVGEGAFDVPGFVGHFNSIKGMLLGGDDVAV